MNFNIQLSEDDMETLGEIGEKQYWASFLWHITMPSKRAGNFTVYKVDALVWKEIVDNDKRGFLPGLPKHLRQRVIALYDNISREQFKAA